jgi:tRNA(Ile)-lysidine synthase
VLDPERCRAVLRHWISELGFRPASSVVLGRILSEVLPARPDAMPWVSWSGCEIRRYRDDLYALAPLPPRPDTTPIPWRKGALQLPHGLGRLTWVDPEGRTIDPDTLHPGGFTVAFGLSGLTCRPPGVQHHRRLKNLFQEAGVPPWLRPYVPLVLAGRSLSAVVDIAICDTAWGSAPRWEKAPWGRWLKTRSA